MILYFADRKMNILGLAGTHLKDGCIITEDLKTSEIETGVSTFSFTITFSDDTRSKMEECLEAGNYVLRSNEDEAEFYTIIDETIDTKEQTIEVYCEDAGMDLLNSDAQPFEAPEAHNIQWYFDKYLSGTGFTVKENQYGTGYTRKLKWEGVSTVAERLASIATQFDNCEISFSFKIENLSIKNKYVNIYKKDGRGKKINDQLRLNRDVDRIITTKSVANLATALYCTGGTPEGQENPITLSGYSYDDGDFYVDGKYLKSRSAVKKWGRFPGFSNHVVKTYSYDTTSQATLCNHAVTELKKICDTEINYEVDMEKLPDDIRIGDRINLVDDAGELYVQTRLLKTEESVCNGTATATLGEFLVKSSGISAKVEQLASQFADLAANRTLYTWIAYADDDQGTNITLDPEGKEYLGTAANRISPDPVITDPTVYTWSKIKGEDGSGITIKIMSSGGTLFKSTKISTTLVAHVYMNGAELTQSEIEELGTLKWYIGGVLQPQTGITFSINESANLDRASVEVQLEAD